MRQSALLLLFALAGPAWAADDTPLRDLAEQPRRYTGVKVVVTVALTGEVTPAADGYSELLVSADGVSLDRLKFRAAGSLARQVPDTGATHEEPLPARLVGRVLGADAAGRGRYVVHVDEVQLLDAKGDVTDTLTPRTAPKPDPKSEPAPPTPEPKQEAKPTPPPAPEAKPEPPAPVAATPEPAAPAEADGSMLPVAAGGGLGLLLAVGVGVFLARRPARRTAGRTSFPSAPPAETGPLTVGDRLNRRAR